MMDSIDNFRNHMSEIDILLKYAANNSSNIPKYQLFNKSSIVLLSTKFEVFLEDFIDEHSLKMLKGHTNVTFPQELKEMYFNRGIELMANEKKQSNKESLFNSIVILFQDKETKISSINNIIPAKSFNYGKHGQGEIESLFKRHGLGVFIKTEKSQNYLKKINSLIAIRNNIIHQDAVPSITHLDIENYKNSILEFVSFLEAELTNNKNKYYNE